VHNLNFVEFESLCFDLGHLAAERRAVLQNPTFLSRAWLWPLIFMLECSLILVSLQLSLRQRTQDITREVTSQKLRAKTHLCGFEQPSNPYQDLQKSDEQRIKKHN